MKRHLLWTFDRGSFQWDVMCVLILAFLFLIPRNAFNDVPEYMKVADSGALRTTVDRNGSAVMTVRLEHPGFLDSGELRSEAVSILERLIGESVRASRIQPIRNWTGRVVAYAVWNEK